MNALAAVPGLPDRRRHVPREEYAAWVRATFADARGTISSRLFFYNRFVQHWPDLEDWFAAPLLDRLDLHADAPPGSGKHMGISHEAGSYLAYLSLVHRIPMDADWVLARNFDSLFNPRVAPTLGMDLDLVDALDERQRQLGYRSGRSLLTWGIARLVLWRGDPDITAITYDDLGAFGEEIRRWCAMPEAQTVRAAHVHRNRRDSDPATLTAEFEKACLSRLHGLHVLLFHRAGQRTTVPRAEDVRAMAPGTHLPGNPARDRSAG